MKLIHSVLFSLVLFTSTQIAQAAMPQCHLLFAESTQELKLEAFKLPNLEPTEKSKIIKLAQRYDVKLTKPTSLVEVIAEAANAIESRRGISRLKKADILASFGAELQSFIRPYSLKQRNRANFLLAFSILRLEAFSTKDFINADKTLMESNLRFARFENYYEHVKDYVDKSPRFQELRSGESAILTFADIRNINAQNFWPIEIKNHDWRHLHYGFGHPLALAAFFLSSRSKNHLRYALVAAVFEGIESFQFIQEQAITKYFREKDYSLEEAMLFLARASNSEIKEILSQLDSEPRKEFLSIKKSFQGWAPTYSSKFPLRDFDQEVLQMIRNFEQMRKDRTVVPYQRYQIHPEVGGSSRSDESIH